MHPNSDVFFIHVDRVCVYNTVHHVHMINTTMSLPGDIVVRVCDFLHNARLLGTVCKTWASALAPMWWDHGFGAQQSMEDETTVARLHCFVRDRMMGGIPHAQHVCLRLGRTVSGIMEAILLYNLSLCLPCSGMRSLDLHLLCDVRLGDIQWCALRDILARVSTPCMERLTLQMGNRHMCSVRGFVVSHKGTPMWIATPTWRTSSAGP